MDLKKQLAHRKVAQPKLGAYSAPSLLLVSITHPARMPDGPAKRPRSCPTWSITTKFVYKQIGIYSTLEYSILASGWSHSLSVDWLLVSEWIWCLINIHHSALCSQQCRDSIESQLVPLSASWTLVGISVSILILLLYRVGVGLTSIHIEFLYCFCTKKLVVFSIVDGFLQEHNLGGMDISMTSEMDQNMKETLNTFWRQG